MSYFYVNLLARNRRQYRYTNPEGYFAAVQLLIFHRLIPVRHRKGLNPNPRTFVMAGRLHCLHVVAKKVTSLPFCL